MHEGPLCSARAINHIRQVALEPRRSFGWQKAKTAI